VTELIFFQQNDGAIGPPGRGARAAGDRAELRSRFRRAVFLVGGLLIIVLVVLAVRHFSRGQAVNANGATAAVPVTAALATRRDVPDLISTIGTVQSIDSVAIQPRVTGAIQKIEFTPGQDVKQGQELFLIDPRPYQAALDQAQAQLAHDEAVLKEAQTDLVRYQTLVKTKAIPEQQEQDQQYVVDQDQGTVKVDEANVETAKLNLEYCHIVSPIDGRAGTLLVELGNLVGPPSGTASASASTSTTNSGQPSTSTTSGGQTTGNGLVSINQLKPIYVTFTVPQSLLDQVKRNQAAGALDVDAYSEAGKLLEKGKLAVIDNQVNTSTGTVTLQATFANPDEVLWPGEFVRARLVVDIRKDAVTIPTEAVMAGPNGSYVYVIGANDQVKRVDIQVTARQGAIAIIGKGLSGGEKVVTNGQYLLDNGTKVAIRQTSETAAPDATEPEAN
jgi:membrane fusion protein, multidrug efflux system